MFFYVGHASLHVEMGEDTAFLHCPKLISRRYNIYSWATKQLQLDFRSFFSAILPHTRPGSTDIYIQHTLNDGCGWLKFVKDYRTLFESIAND